MPKDDPLIGRTLANYRIERLLGRGGMASVYYGFDSQLQRPAAIKVIDERHSGEAFYSERFVREARAMAAWRHPNIPQIYQAGLEDGIFYYAMEYIQGMDLEEVLRRSVQLGELLPFKDVLVCGKAIADALDYAHLHGAIHRDVKPANVLISEDDRILLTDFGLVLEVAKGTMGEVFGSPLYIAPEQARSSADAVPQSDLYSLGVILYEMLVGRLPFEDGSPTSLAIKHISLAPPAPRQFNPDLSPEIDAVLLKALRKLPQERYQTGKELMTALEKGIGGQVDGIRILHSDPPPPATLPFLPTEAEDHLEDTLINPRPSGYQPSGPNSPTPTAVRYNQEGSKSDRVKQLFALLSHKKFALPAIIAVSSLAILCVLVFGAASLFGRLNEPSPGTASQPSYLSTFYAAQTQVTPTLTAVPTATNISITPSPTSNLSEIRLSLAWQQSEDILLINQGDVGVPLAKLLFEAKKNKLTGDEWEIEILQPGECVTVLKSESKSGTPVVAQCKLVGKLLTRGGPNKFLDAAFDVYFQDTLVTSCELKKGLCDLEFNYSPP